MRILLTKYLTFIKFDYFKETISGTNTSKKSKRQLNSDIENEESANANVDRA